MVATLIVFGVLFLVQTVASAYVILTLIREGRAERQALEDRLLEVCEPEAAARVTSASDGPTKARISYMDDNRMAEIERGPS